ncbi:hypothetical protein ILUMI_20377 [Ignelater luminosus]|uniref:Death domain-containing protein n=1 Tax=Ignelater luminosus TaxID=2038154 RepID=A0A8K0G4M1_IGNLU|nr:hypothetical protein ILUMI_20377 [Ignelater luminosus]
MASQQYNVEDLTTDACPSPPREDEQTSHTEFKNRTSPDSTSNLKNKKKKPKTKKISTQVANVININNSNGIHIGSNFTINMGKPQKEEKIVEEEIVKTEAICKLLQDTNPVTKEIISFVSEYIGKNWRIVARKLGYSEGQIDQHYEKNFVIGIREVVYQILLDWIQNKPLEAKVGILCTVLWNAPEKDVVQRMANEYDSNKY